MNREIILVQVIDGEELFSYSDKAKAFVDTKEAEGYFREILKNDFNVNDEETIEECIDNGFFADDTHFSVTIQEIVLRDYGVCETGIF